jgi:hypothetical protein
MLYPNITRLIRRKSNGKLVVPSKSTLNIVLHAEALFLTEGQNGLLPRTNNLIANLNSRVLREVHIQDLFPSLANHTLQQNPALEEMHAVTIVRLIIYRYMKVHCLSYCNVINQQRKYTTFSRNKITKSIQFRRE